MSRIVRWLLAALALALAPVLLFQGQANSMLPSGPWLTRNGFNLADLAQGGLRAREDDGTTTLVVERRGLELARRAFVREPMATNALFVLAIDERAGASRLGEQPLLNAALALDKRNRFLGGLKVEQIARVGDFPGTFALLDRMARIYPEMTAELARPLVQGLAQENAVDVIAEALAGEPVWGNAFWRAVPADPALVGRMLELRQRTDRGTDPVSDAALLSALAASGQFDDAFAFRDRLLGTAPTGTGFVPIGGSPPFGWQAEASGERSFSQRGERGYEVFVQQGTNGELGRQLLRLAPGRYTFSASVTPVSSAENMTARMICATSEGLELPAVPLSGPATFTVPASCRTWWLVLGGNAWAVSGGLRSAIGNMRFEAAS